MDVGFLPNETSSRCLEDFFATAFKILEMLFGVAFSLEMFIKLVELRRFFSFRPGTSSTLSSLSVGSWSGSGAAT